MKFSLRRVLSVSLAVLSLTAAIPVATAQPASDAPVLTGQWSSAAPEAMGDFHGTREFSFTDDRWEIVFRAYADKDGTQPLFTLRNGGAYVLGGPSAKVAGAWEGIFPQISRLVVADSEAGVALFARMGCQLEQGVPLAVMQEACGFVSPLMQAMGEYDLVAIREGQLFFGDRAGDLLVSRPEKLTPYPLVRR